MPVWRRRRWWGRGPGDRNRGVYITTEAGVPSEELVEEVRADLQEKREIAVDVSVCVPTKKTVNVADRGAVC